MNRTLVSSHVSSATLHAGLLLLAMMVPPALVLEDPPPAYFAEASRTAVFTASTPPVVPHETFAPSPGTGRGTVSGADASGSEPDARKAQPKQRLRVATATASISQLRSGAELAGEVGRLLAGFSDKTLGSNAETALGTLDEGGGSGKPTHLGFGLPGFGATCATPPKSASSATASGKKACDPAKLASGLSGIGRLAGRRERQAQPDLGEKDETPAVVVAVGTPTSCIRESACPWRDIIASVIARHRREVSHCYEQALRRHGRAFDAEINLALGLSPAGGTPRVRLDPGSGEASLDACVLTRAKRWIFPATGQSIRAHYPYRFRTL